MFLADIFSLFRLQRPNQQQGWKQSPGWEVMPGGLLRLPTKLVLTLVL